MQYPLFKDFIQTYLNAKRKGKSLSPLSLENYERILMNYVIPIIGEIPINEITAQDIQRFVDAQNERVQPSSVKRYLVILQSVFTYAKKRRMISESPADIHLLETPRFNSTRIRFYNQQQLVAMIAKLQQEPLPFQAMIQLALTTGARRGELVALQFDAFDFAERRVWISYAAFKEVGKPAAIKSTKGYEERTVKIPQAVIELVQELYRLQRITFPTKDPRWLFTTNHGDMMNPHTPSKQFQKFVKRCGLPYYGFHSLRHTSATLMLQNGINIYEVKRRLGHASLSTTEIYLHYIREADEKAAQVFDTILNQSPD